MYDIRPLVKDIKKIVDNHLVGGVGEYAQWTMQNDAGNRNLSVTQYGSAIATNILYTICSLPENAEDRIKMANVLKGFQNPETGLFVNEGNVITHTTAFISGALELLDTKPDYKAVGLNEYLTKEGLFAFLDSINWDMEPWLGAHYGAGIYASVLLTGLAGNDWEDMYFEWFDENADPVTGLWKKGSLGGAPMFHYLASTFHYVFNYEYAKRALPYPKQLLDTCIKAYRNGDCIDFAKEFGWADIDFTYLLARVGRRVGERNEEVTEILREIADGLIGQLMAIDITKDKCLDDINTLFAIVCALAVLQEALPGYIRTEKPLRLVIDRRPFL